MNKPLQQDREDRAVDALIAAALHQAEYNEPTDEEIQTFLKNIPPVSPAGKVALDALGPGIVARLSGETSKHVQHASVMQLEEEISPLYAAMNRKHSASEMDARTKKELEKKRKEALERITKRKKRGEK